MTTAELADLFVTTLLRELGGNRRRWRGVLGEARLYSEDTHPHCNWSFTPHGTAAENAAVERVADRLRGQHPIVRD
ncbi:MAG: hypothetical protein J7500_17075 [Sphingomonas sp.]|uniref:hypothetical protein n=1 Tax=Sphingomonas sp. TaxID=28214 RepID=UPI001B20FA3E|nr:hypothetical protein [Sphingomonas sp.]MBO9624423.1 hypothetical protein [Sphingomonas sp.]